MIINRILDKQGYWNHRIASLFIRENNDPCDAVRVQNDTIVYSERKHKYGTDELTS